MKKKIKIIVSSKKKIRFEKLIFRKYSKMKINSYYFKIMLILPSK